MAGEAKENRSMRKTHCVWKRGRPHEKEGRWPGGAEGSFPLIANKKTVHIPAMSRNQLLPTTRSL
jgi:hypothetical protein